MNKLLNVGDKMIIINDFFKRRKEAVSNQMELIAKDNNCEIVAATRFMGQKTLQEEDLKDKIYVYSPYQYPFKIIKHLKFSYGIIHIFEEQPSKFKEIVFNLTRRPVYVSLYRMPSSKECEHLKKYKNLKGIFVELELHKNKLINKGFDSSIIHITPTPTKFERKKSDKIFDPNNINILFASWNIAEGKPLYDRGLIYLLELLETNKFLYLTVILRDKNIEDFVEELNNRKLANRVEMIDVKTDKELEKIFEKCDFVAFPAQKRIVKDVPNSLIDGLCKGKPVIISDVLNFSEIVTNKNIGFVVKNGGEKINLNISKENYEELSNNAFEYSEMHSKENYVKIIKKGYVKNGRI